MSLKNLLQKRSIGTWAFFLLIFLFFAVLPASGQEYPIRPIKIIIPFGPGGVNTVIWRSMVDPLSKILGQPVVIENKPGGGTSLGHTLQSKAEPDGYTMGSAPLSGIFNTFLAYDVSYHPFKSFTYIGGMWEYNEVLAIRSDSPWKTWAELLDYINKNPDEVKVGFSNPIASAVVSMKYIAKKQGLKWKEVTMVGEAPLVTALLGGHIHAFVGAGVVHTLLKDGRARALLAITATPVPGHPELPTVKELYGINAFNVCGMNGPAGVPGPIVKKLENALKEGTKSPLYINTVEKMGAVVRFRNSQEFNQDAKIIFETQHEILKELDMLKKK